MNEQRLNNLIFEIKFTQKQTKKRAAKAESERKAAEAELKRELSKGRPDIARIAAAKVVRKERQHRNLKDLEFRLDGIVDQLKDAATTKKIAADMKKVSIGLGRITAKETDAVKVNDIMEKFNAETENLDLTSKGLQDMMNEASASTTDPEAEDKLMSRAQEELGIETSQSMPDTTTASKAKAMTIDEQREQDLEERLRRVRA